MSEWRPIETAPRDGTKFLAFERRVTKWSTSDIFVVVRWEVTQAWMGDNIKRGPDDGFWKEADGEDWYTYTPSHWMPLPSPPEEA